MRTTERFAHDLEKAALGDQAARDRVYSHSYRELLGLAKAALDRGWRDKVSLSTGDVLHDAFVRLCGRAKVGRNGRAYFFACFAKTCRDVVVDHWRKQRGARTVPLVPEMLSDGGSAFDPVELDDLLQRLSVHDPRGATVATMRLFASMDHAEVAQALDVSWRTVAADWAHARRWLMAQCA
jgi:RNA polymerase sigma factor (TIGR02999 family)